MSTGTQGPSSSGANLRLQESARVLRALELGARRLYARATVLRYDTAKRCGVACVLCVACVG